MSNWPKLPLTLQAKLREDRRMLYESSRVRLETEPHFATLWLSQPRVEDLHAVATILERTPHIERLVVRSVSALRFSAEVDGTLVARFARLPLITVALLEGLVSDGGLELALACEYRLAVASPNTWLGLAAGRVPYSLQLPRLAETRLIAGEYLTAREACDLGIVDDAFTRRRAKIELQTWLNRVRPRWRSPQLRRMRTTTITERPRPIVIAADELPQVLGVVQCPTALPIAVEFLLRGRHVVTDQPETLERLLCLRELRGRATPLELDQARRRIQSHTYADVDLILLGHSECCPAVVRKHTVRLCKGGAEQPYSWLGWSTSPNGWVQLNENLTMPQIMFESAAA